MSNEAAPVFIQSSNRRELIREESGQHALFVEQQQQRGYFDTFVIPSFYVHIRMCVTAWLATEGTREQEELKSVENTATVKEGIFIQKKFIEK